MRTVLKGAAAVVCSSPSSSHLPTDDLAMVLARVPSPRIPAHLPARTLRHGARADDAAYRHGDGSRWWRRSGSGPPSDRVWSDRLGARGTSPQVSSVARSRADRGRARRQLVDVSGPTSTSRGCWRRSSARACSRPFDGHATPRLPVSDRRAARATSRPLRRSAAARGAGGGADSRRQGHRALDARGRSRAAVELRHAGRGGGPDGERHPPPGAGDREQHDRRPHDDHAAAWQSARAAPAARRVAEAAGRRARLPRDRHDRCPARLPTVAGQASACSRR